MSGELPQLVDDVRRWYAATILAVGLRTGLAAALLDGGGRADELAARAGVNSQNATAWADAMVVAGYASRDGERYAPDEDAIGLLRGGFAFDLGAVVEILAPLGGMIPRVEQAIRDGNGIGSHEIQERLGVLPEQVNNPMYAQYLLARTYRASSFVGYDLDPAQVARATASAAEEGLRNLRFEARDAAALP